MTKQHVGLIGLGKMGAPMAANIARAGYPLTVFDLNEDTKRDVAAATGATASPDTVTLARDCDVIITMVPDGKAVRALLIDGGLADAAGAGSIFIDMSSSDPNGTRALGTEMESRGLKFIDAPVSGGVKGAENATLSIMIGGDSAVIDECEALLSTMGGQLFRTGALGCGHAMKALNNYVSAAGAVAAIEALRMGEAFGLDPDHMTDILNVSTGRNNTTEKKLKQHVIPRTYASGFSLGLMTKDIATAVAVGKATGQDIPFAESCLAYWADALEKIGPDADHTAVVDKPKT
jgi:3-hydroxyisobutyrate dehydrogenase